MQAMDSFNNLYREEILEHYRSPLNFGKLSFFDTTSRQLNPFCGDEIEIYVKFQRGKDSKVQSISFKGKGCAISMAAGSILTEFTKGKTKKELTNFLEEDMLSLLGVSVSETRKKCALLAHSVLQDCI